MPIVFIHGVATRNYKQEHSDQWVEIEALLRRHIAPVISSDARRVDIIPAYWGDIGVQFAWNGASLPLHPSTNPTDHPLWQLFGGKHTKEWQQEALRRAIAIPGHLTTRSLDGVRQALNQQVLQFLGDIFSYFHHREAVIARVKEALAAARRSQEARGGEPLVVLSHSMGGQIVYDLVTYYLPQAPTEEQVCIDFWAATASQVGVFEEMKLFKASMPLHQTGYLVPHPDRRFLGAWWNVWDPNDALSFTVSSIIADVDDTHYESGLGMQEAHNGILTLPSFYSIFGARLSAALLHRKA